MNEGQRIIEAVDKFANKMKTKMLEKLAEGYHGWDDPKNEDFIFSSLIDHARKKDIKKELIDIPCLCMMLDRFQESEEDKERFT